MISHPRPAQIRRHLNYAQELPPCRRQADAPVAPANESTTTHIPPKAKTKRKENQHPADEPPSRNHAKNREESIPSFARRRPESPLPQTHLHENHLEQAQLPPPNH